MATKEHKERNSGFSLAEILVYVAIIGIVGALFGGVLVTVTKVQTRQSSSAEVNTQLNFVLQTAQRLIRESSLVDIAAGTPTSSLTLRMQDSAEDPILLYLQDNAVYFKVGAAEPAALTTDAVKVDKLQFTKLTSYPGHDTVQIDLTVSYNTDNPEKEFSRSRNAAVARASAAVFDADLVPGATNSYDVGLTDSRWKNLFLSGNLAIGNTLTLGNLSVEPSGMNGMLYYNTALNTFRGFRNGAWADLGYWNLSGNDISLNVSGNVGIGTTGAPTEKLTVQGNVLASGSLSSASLAISGAGAIGGDLTVTGTAQVGGFKMASGAATGKVLTSDADGVGTWQTPTGGTGIPPGYSILGDTTTSPAGYTYTGNYVEGKTIEGWVTKANMPTARHSLAAATVNNKIYAVAGTSWPTQEYDPATNTWATKAVMPYGSDSEAAAAAVVNNKIYVIGGFNTYDMRGFAYNREYNPVTDTWATKANMPTARGYLAAVAVNDKIYAIGGDNGITMNNNEEYNPATNTWATKAVMPTAREMLAAGAVNNKIYAIGGGYYYTAGNKNEEYDPSTNAWTTKTPMPTLRYGLTAAAVGGRIYAIGGRDGSGSHLAVNEEYNPTANSWSTKTSMPTARRFLASAAANNKIYAIGGINATSYLNTNEEYTPPITTLYYVHKKD